MKRVLAVAAALLFGLAIVHGVEAAGSDFTMNITYNMPELGCTLSNVSVIAKGGCGPPRCRLNSGKKNVSRLRCGRPVEMKDTDIATPAPAGPLAWTTSSTFSFPGCDCRCLRRVKFFVGSKKGLQAKVNCPTFNCKFKKFTMNFKPDKIPGYVNCVKDNPVTGGVCEGDGSYAQTINAVAKFKCKAPKKKKK